MAYYNKGANAERELIHLLYNEGLAVLRVAGSGSSTLPCPDAVALSPGLKIAFECKAWNKAHLSISMLQMTELHNWAKTAGTDLFVAWKIPRKGWRFLKPRQFNKTEKAYNISMKKALEEGLELKQVLALAK